MAEKVASLYAEITAKTDGVKSALSDVKSQVQGAGSSFKSFAEGIAKGAAFVTAEMALLKKVFDFGDAGASILQVEASFNELMRSVGAAPSTFNEMRSAAQATVSDFELMASANTLLVGATGELGSAFAAALPELVGIAKAANTLNPNLGTTTFLFDSLARGIKRASPLILDNLGIVVDLSTVYGSFAASIGKTTEQLTKEEQSMALLNAVLEQGRNITEQAANAQVEAAVKIDRMQAAVENAANALKADFAPAIANAADAIYYLLTGAQQINSALATHATDVAKSAGTYLEYSQELNRAARAAGHFVDEQGNLVDIIGTAHGPVTKLIQENYRVSESMWMADKAAEGYSLALSKLTQKSTEQTEAVFDQERAWTTYGERLTATAEAAGFTAITMSELHIMSVALAAGLEGRLGSATEAYSATLADLAIQHEEMTAQLLNLQNAGYSPTSERVMELTRALEENQNKQSEALASLQGLTAEMIYNQAAAGLDTQAALDLARSMGLLDEQSYAVASAVEALRLEFDKNRDGMISSAEGAAQFAASTDLMNRAIANLQAKNMPITLDAIATEMTTLAQTGASNELSETAGAAEDAAPGLDAVVGAAKDAASEANTLAGSVEDQNAALEAVRTAANVAEGGLKRLGDAVDSAMEPLGKAAQAANRLASAISSIDQTIKINVTTSGFESAIALARSLANAVSAIPTQVSIQNTGSPGGGGGGGGGTGGNSGALMTELGGVTNVYNYNITDTLAATMLLEQKRREAAIRMEGVLA